MPVIVLLCITVAAGTFAIGAFAPLLPEVAAAARLTDAELGMVAGMIGFARMLADLPVGLLARRRLRAGLLLAPFVLVAGLACLTAGGPLPLLLLGRGLMGFGHAMGMVSALTAVLRFTSRARLGAALNSIELSGMLGLLGGVTTIGAISRQLPWTTAYLLACSPLAAALLIAPWLQRALRHTETQPAAPPAAAGLRPDGGQHRWLVPLAFVTGAFVSCGYSTIEQFLIPVRGSRHFDLDRTGIARLLQIVQAVDIAALLPAGVIADRRGPAPTLAVMTLIMAGAMALVAFGGLPMVAAGCALLGVSMAGWMLPLGVIRHGTPPERVAWRTAVYRVGVDAGIFIGPFLSGLLGTRFPALMPALLATGLATVGVLMLVALARRARPV